MIGHTRADAQFFAQNEVMSKKKVITFPNDQFLTQNEVKTKKKVITFADKGMKILRGGAAGIMEGIHLPWICTHA